MSGTNVLTGRHVPQQLRKFERELLADRALVEKILSDEKRFPRGPQEPEPVTIRVRREDVERGICRAIALAAQGILATVEWI